MSNTFTSSNPGLLLTACRAIRSALSIYYQLPSIDCDGPVAWECYFFGPGCASIKDERGKSWDIDTNSLKVIPA